MSANGLFVLASARGYLSVVSVLGSLYPVVTLLAAYALLGERISRVQRSAVALALAGVAVVAAVRWAAGKRLCHPPDGRHHNGREER